MDAISELAKLFKERENIPYMGPIVGTVISPPPDIKIQTDKNIILDKTHLIISASVYGREFDIKGANIVGQTLDVTVGDHGEHKHEIKILDINGQLKLVYTLKKGDKVILIPSQDEQTYFLLDWAVKL